MKNRDYIGENLYSGIFGVGVYKSLIRFKIQNGGFMMATAKMKNRDNYGENTYKFGWFSSVSSRITKLLKKNFSQTYIPNTTLLLPANFDINIVSEKPVCIRLQTKNI